jgi:hypothetical protein
MFDGTSPRDDEPDPSRAAGQENRPWQLGALLLALALANCLAAVFCPDVITDPGLKF